MQQLTEVPPGPGLLDAHQGTPVLASELSIIRVTLFIFSPVSCAVGSPGLWYSQPLTEAAVPYAGFWVLVVDAIVEIAALFFRRHPCPGTLPEPYGPPGTVKMTIPELADFLRRIKAGALDLPRSQNQIESPKAGVQLEDPSWFTVFVLISGYVEPGESSPRLSLFVPLFTVNGLIGSLPILIMGLIATILVRMAVPPASCGVQPLSERKQEPKFQFELKELLNLLRGYTHYFK